MTKNPLYFFIFFVYINTYCQIKDTVRLDKLEIYKINKHIKHIKTKGRSSSMTGNVIKGVISKVDQIPDGKLSSIKLFFNNSPIFFIKDNDKTNYKDVELGLLIYDVKDDGSPGELLSDKEIIFTLNSKNNSFIELDLNPLYLSTSKTLFFGIELLNKQIGKDFKIMTKCNNKNSSLLYFRTWNSEIWHNDSNMPCAMKLDIGVILPN